MQDIFDLTLLQVILLIDQIQKRYKSMKSDNVTSNYATTEWLSSIARGL